MTTIDQTFVISLLTRTDRREVLNYEFDQYNFTSYRYWMAAYHEVGATGLRHSITYLFEHALSKNYNTILVLEDDATFVNDPQIYLGPVLHQLPNDFHVCYLGCNLLLPPTQVSENILRLSAAYASHACIYSQEGMRLILDCLKEDDNLPYDMVLQKKIQSLGYCYASYPMILNQRPGKSDIFKYNPNEHFGIGQYYDEETGILDWGAMMKHRYDLLTKNLMPDAQKRRTPMQGNTSN